MILLAGLLAVMGAYYGWRLITYAGSIVEKPANLASQARYPFVSVVIPARNEADTLPNCLKRVLMSEYPADRFEVIVVDDDSKDQTAPIVERLIANLSGKIATRVRLTSTDREPGRTLAHKKAALEAGIGLATGEILLLTDADCEPKPGWVPAMVASFDVNTGFVSGPLAYYPARSFLERLLALEMTGLVGLGFGAIGRGHPTMCNGANVAFRRSVFDAVGGYEDIDHLSSGDDELLMHKIAYETTYDVVACQDSAAIVSTAPPHSISELYAQRKRWASKGTRYPQRSVAGSASLMFVFFVLLLLGALLAPWSAPVALGFLFAFVVKVLADLLLLKRASPFAEEERLMMYYWPATVLQIPYVVFFAFAGLFGGYTWKGRKLDI